MCRCTPFTCGPKPIHKDLAFFIHSPCICKQLRKDAGIDQPIWFELQQSPLAGEVGGKMDALLRFARVILGLYYFRTFCLSTDNGISYCKDWASQTHHTKELQTGPYEV